MIAVVGGSITNRAVQGYQRLGGLQLWGGKWLDGGTLDAWDRDPTYFSYLQLELAAEHPTACWWQLCAHDGEVVGEPESSIDAVIDRVLNRILAVTLLTEPAIVVSAMARYPEPTPCQNGEMAAPIMEAALERLLSRRAVTRGPLMPPLTADLLQDGGTGCHQNAKGRRVHGEVLLAWFD